MHKLTKRRYIYRNDKSNEYWSSDVRNGNFKRMNLGCRNHIMF